MHNFIKTYNKKSIFDGYSPLMQFYIRFYSLYVATCIVKHLELICTFLRCHVYVLTPLAIVLPRVFLHLQIHFTHFTLPHVCIDTACHCVGEYIVNNRNSTNTFYITYYKLYTY